MQRFFTLLSTSLVLFSNVLFAQNCPTNPTYKNTSGTYTLSAGRSYVVDNGASVSVTVQSDFSATSTICVTNGSKLTLQLKNVRNIAAGGSIYVDAASMLILTGSNISDFPLTITTYGTFTQNTGLTLNSGAIINNYGSYSAAAALTFNSGTVHLNNSGTFNCTSVATFNSGTFTINNNVGGILTFSNDISIVQTAITNKGTLNFTGSLNFTDGASFTNIGYTNFHYAGTTTINKTPVNNYGLIASTGTIVLNSSTVLNNWCTLLCSKDFINNATVNNEGIIRLRTDLAGYQFNNQGTFVNGENGFVQGTEFHNSSGTITGGGNFYFTNKTENNSSFTGTDGNYINFYDASAVYSNGQPFGTTAFFDVQSVQPSFTTKFPIEPITTPVGDTVCGEPIPPVITVQPQVVKVCDTSVTSATFSVGAKSRYGRTRYQWRKNGQDLAGENNSSYVPARFRLADTADVYSVAVTNKTGTTESNGTRVRFVVVAAPPSTVMVATGNPTTLAIQTSDALALQWKKNGKDLYNGDNLSYRIPVVNLQDSGKYIATITYSGGTCRTDTVVVKPSIILYSKAKGNLKDAANWGVEKDGSGSTPVDFTREEHTFVVANRGEIETGDNIDMAGTLDVADGSVAITPGTTLNVGRVTRSGSKGGFTGSATSSLKVHGISDTKHAGNSELYFNKSANVLQSLIVAGHTVRLRNGLNITAGKNPGRLQVESGIFETSDSLTLKSDSLGTAIVAESYGIIKGKATIERYMPARRGWRLMCSPVTMENAPTINAAWQEGATSSTDNPKPGYGTHITYGNVADGFDQNPQKTFSMYYYNAGKWYGVPATNKTPVTQYPAYLFFVRGDRSYDILSTTNTMAPRPTILRTFGNLNQGQQQDIQVSNTNFTLVSNPYASPIDFEKLYNNSSNLKHTLRVWDPNMAGSKGVGAYITLDWTGTGYKATPPSAMSHIIQPYQAFFVESATANATGTTSINETTKNITTITSPFGRPTGRQVQDGMLEVNLRVFNEDGTTGIADGVLYRFNDAHSNAIDQSDVKKLNNLYENLSISSNNTLLAIERRGVMSVNDTLRLNLTGVKSTSYQLEIVLQAIGRNMFLYDNYLKTLSPINPADTNRFTIAINTADASSKAASRFSIVLQQQVVLPVTFSSAKAYAKGTTVQVEWNVANEIEVAYYQVERSANGTTFTKAGEVKATGAAAYSFNDATPFSGNSYYRVKSVDKSGKAAYTNILPVTMDNSNSSAVSSLSIYPNPLRGKAFQVQLSNKAAGTYTLSMVSSSGQQLYTQTISHTGGTATYQVQLQNNLASGMYFIKATAADGTADVVKATVQ